MPVIYRSALAETDYREIWRYIARDNPDAADQLLRYMDAKLELYANKPQMGTKYEKLAPGLRGFPVGNYLLFYRIIPDGIELVRVLHGARKLKRLIKVESSETD
ncbi:MAG TPA: type II toxin-antitoxin system RelE/ParE family toxin [Phycisphaerae bacterium]|nr:type II toxin-antitoxin system RelE/ParE family toxin [Phycisphaerae bacterium]